MRLKRTDLGSLAWWLLGQRLEPTLQLRRRQAISAAVAEGRDDMGADHGTDVAGGAFLAAFLFEPTNIIAHHIAHRVVAGHRFAQSKCRARHSLLRLARRRLRSALSTDRMHRSIGA